MPRGPRIDAPGLLHHVRARGVEKRKIFLSDDNREDFLNRLNRVCEEHEAILYAWCLMSNHFHLAIRTGKKPLAKTMTSILTGYAMRFNLVHRRSGHLFQNRYKSTVVDDEKYFLGLVRYIHRNPLRARVVNTLEALQNYPWTGHAVLMGNKKIEIQDVDAVLGYFGKQAGKARRELALFMGMPEAKKEEKLFKGGGLIRSIGGRENIEEHRRSEKWAYDERILGDGKFVESVLKGEEKQTGFQFQPKDKKWEMFEEVAKKLCEQYEVQPAELTGGSRRRAVSEVRSLLAYFGHRELGLSAAEIGRAFDVSSQAVLKGIKKAEETWESLDWLKEKL